MYGNAEDRAAWDRMRARGFLPGPRADECHGLPRNAWVAGVDFYCDGTMSRARRRHDRVVLARFRWSTCPDSDMGEDWWMVPLVDGTLPQLDRPPGAPAALSLQCPACTLDAVRRIEAVTHYVCENRGDHTRRVARCNVELLLVS